MIQVICRDDEKSQNLIYVKNQTTLHRDDKITKTQEKFNLCEKHLFMLKQIKSDAHG
jgi:hypothetical protein